MAKLALSIVRSFKSELFDDLLSVLAFRNNSEIHRREFELHVSQSNRSWARWVRTLEEVTADDLSAGFIYGMICAAHGWNGAAADLSDLEHINEFPDWVAVTYLQLQLRLGERPDEDMLVAFSERASPMVALNAAEVLLGLNQEKKQWKSSQV